MKHHWLLLPFLFLILPISARASLEITEVMYDPEGSDTDREWIEFLNTGQEITIVGGSGNTWRLYEESASGALSKRTFSFAEEAQNETTIPAGALAVIAKDADGFMQDFPEFEGLLFFASFSLTNASGKMLTFYTENEGPASDPFVYTPLPEASGTGASLQLQSDSSWVAGLPTPGTENTEEPFEAESKDGTIDEEVSDDFLDLESDWPFSNEKVFIDIGGNMRIFVDEEIEFEADVRFKNGDRVRGASVSWAFGEGDGERGNEAAHSYAYPGLYRVVARAEYGGKLYQDAIRVQVLSTDAITLGEIKEGGVEVVNTSDFEVEVSNWVLEGGEEEKDLAPGTYILPQGTVTIPLGSKGAPVSLYDSTGDLVATAEATQDSLLRDESYEEIQRLLVELIALSNAAHAGT